MDTATTAVTPYETRCRAAQAERDLILARSAPIPTTIEGLPKLRDDDEITVGGRDFTIGTVVGYALKYHHDPIAAYAREVARGHETVFILQNCIVLYAGPRRPEPKRTELAVGAHIVIHGHVYRIVPAPNDNLRPLLVGRVDHFTVIPV
jgi:hypothetical protein